MPLRNLSLNHIRPWFLRREKDSHKGTFGHVLVVGGDEGMPGAVRMAAECAARIGAGAVTVITRPQHVPIVVTGRPELLCYGLESAHPYPHLIERANVVLLGPGLGQSTWSENLFKWALTRHKLLLIDADGLTWLAKQFASVPRNNWVLTPHPGEAARLLNCSIDMIQGDRPQAVKLLQQKYGGVVVLKGHGTLIATEDPNIYRCVAGNPGMASAGMGDVLSGIIAGLMAQGIELSKAARAGVILHATAGDRVAKKYGERGMLAMDLIAELPGLLRPQTDNRRF